MAYAGVPDAFYPAQTKRARCCDCRPRCVVAGVVIAAVVISAAILVSVGLTVGFKPSSSSAAPPTGAPTLAPTQAPTTAAPTVHAPTAAPSTAAPTSGPTLAPTTAAPTAGGATSPPTNAPTTAAPTAGGAGGAEATPPPALQPAGTSAGTPAWVPWFAGGIALAVVAIFVARWTHRRRRRAGAAPRQRQIKQSGGVKGLFTPASDVSEVDGEESIELPIVRANTRIEAAAERRKSGRTGRIIAAVRRQADALATAVRTPRGGTSGGTTVAADPDGDEAALLAVQQLEARNLPRRLAAPSDPYPWLIHADEALRLSASAALVAQSSTRGGDDGGGTGTPPSSTRRSARLMAQRQKQQQHQQQQQLPPRPPPRVRRGKPVAVRPRVGEPSVYEDGEDGDEETGLTAQEFRLLDARSGSDPEDRDESELNG